jgi:hypothetical protein
MNTNPERIDFNRRHLLSGAAVTAVAARLAMLTSANAQSAEPKLPDIKPGTTKVAMLRSNTAGRRARSNGHPRLWLISWRGK